MKSDRTYYAHPSLAPARRLQRAGDWMGALRLVPPGTAGDVLRAEILVDRHTWRLDPVDEALSAIDTVHAADPDAAAFLTAVLEFWRTLAGSGGASLGPDPVAQFAGLDGAASIAPGWAAFWHGVTLENLRKEQDAAQAAYRRALAVALDEPDPLLESYVVRHQAFFLVEHDREAGLGLLRRSIQLRAACGARPHVAAAQAALAEVLGLCAESALLARLVALTARELDLTWLKPGWKPGI